MTEAEKPQKPARVGKYEQDVSTPVDPEELARRAMQGGAPRQDRDREEGAGEC